MLLILINWIYIFISSLNFGFIVKKIVKINDENFTTHHVLGLFLISVFAWIYALFLPLNFVFYIVFFSINFFSLLFFRKKIKNLLYKFKDTFNSFKKKYKLGLAIVFIASLTMSASVPSIFDNESYYLQTIKWLNEYGFVKGLGNLHIFFAQTSSWHILQASFTFPFFETNFNDLNGFLLVLFSLFCFQKLQNYNTSKKLYDLYIGTTLISIPFLIFFINAPSPDLPVFLISQILFYLFIKNYKKIDFSTFVVILILTIFLFVIKITTCILILLPLTLLIKHYQNLKNKLIKPLILSCLVVLLFLIKNTILTGYLLYPLEFFDIVDVDWKVPTEIVTLFKNGTYSAAFDYKEVKHLSNFQLFILWLNSFKINGLINAFFITLLSLFPFLWYVKSKEKPLFLIYCFALFHFILAWKFSPQYRFFFFFMLFLSIQILVWFIKKEKIIVLLIYFGFCFCLVPFFTELKLSSYTTIKKTNTKTSILKLVNIVKPSPNSSMSLEFKEYTVNNFRFNSPSEESYFWTSGNGELPTVNNKQIQFIKRNYSIVPSLRTTNLKDGFKSVILE